jgi:hypothetical protein
MDGAGNADHTQNFGQNVHFSPGSITTSADSGAERLG